MAGASKLRVSRETILRAAESEFAAHGLSGARSAAIAMRANVNPALPFYYFGSKQKLYVEILKKILKDLCNVLDESLQSSQHFEGRLRAFIAKLSDYLRKNPNALRIIVRELIDEGSPASSLARRIFSPAIARAHQAIDEGISTGCIRPVDSLEVMVHASASVLFCALLEPLFEKCGLEGSRRSEPTVCREEAVARAILDGLRPR